MTVAAIIETQNKLTPSNALGLVRNVFDYQIDRNINQVGTWSCTIAIDDTLGLQVRRGWRLTLIEEGLVTPQFLLYQGIVLTRKYTGVSPGGAVLELRGVFKTNELVQKSTHSGMAFVAEVPATIAEILADEIISTPIGLNTTVTFNEISRYAALLKLGELKRWNLRETFASDALEYTSTDNTPNSGYTLATVEEAGGDLSAVHEMGIALLGDMPSIEYVGDNIITKVIPVGSDIIDDPANPGNPLQVPLTLQWSTRTAPYAVRLGTNDDGTHYYYLEDDIARANYTDGGSIELYIVRSDVANPSDDVGTRQAAANVLYDLAASELFYRRSEFINLSVDVVNGDKIWALPGDAIRIEYEGDVYDQVSGKTAYVRLSRYMLILSRTDKSNENGFREVSFVISSPTFVPAAATIILPPAPGNTASPLDPGFFPDPYGSIPSASPTQIGFTDATAIVTDGTEPLPDVPLGLSLDLYIVAGAEYARLVANDLAWTIKAGIPASNPTVLRALTGNVMYHAGDSLQISTDQGESWATVIMPHAGGAVDVQATIDGKTWLAIDDGTSVYIYVYNGVTWTLSTTMGAPLGYQNIGISQVDALKIAVSFVTGGGNGKCVYTLDGGTTWNTIGTTDPSIAAQQQWFWTNTNRMVALQAYSSEIKIEYSDGPPYTFFPVDHTAIADATASATGVTGRKWMMTRDSAEHAIFAGIAATSNRIYRSTDNCTTFVKIGAYPTSGTALVGLQYDFATDQLFALFANGNCYSLPAASNASWATRVAGDWIALPNVGVPFNSDSHDDLALLQGSLPFVPGEVI